MIGLGNPLQSPERYRTRFDSNVVYLPLVPRFRAFGCCPRCGNHSVVADSGSGGSSRTIALDSWLADLADFGQLASSCTELS